MLLWIPLFLVGILYTIKCRRLNSEIPINTIEEGLAIWHGQCIIINSKAKIGKNFSISAHCCVGQAHGEFPILGDNIEMTIDSKILGGITIANNTTVGAGSIVLKDVLEEHTTLGGIPAKVISRKPNENMISKQFKINAKLLKYSC